MKKEILHEPNFDMPHYTVWQDKVNLGYCGYKKSLNTSVKKVKDIRMLANYFLYLLTNEECKEWYPKIKRDYSLNVRRATVALINTVIESALCRGIPVVYGETRQLMSASDMASHIVIAGMDKRNLTDQISAVRKLAEQLQYHFYAHIDDIRFKNSRTNKEGIEL